MTIAEQLKGCKFLYDSKKKEKVGFKVTLLDDHLIVSCQFLIVDSQGDGGVFPK